METKACPYILVVALSPDDKLIYEFNEDFQEGLVNRAGKVHRVAAGKGVNAARAIRCLGEPVTVVGVAGGAGGVRIVEGLEDIGAVPRFTLTASATRCCVTLIDRKKTVTELVENCGPVTAEELDEFRRTFEEYVEGASVVLLAGSVPADISVTIYAELTRIARKHRPDIPVIIDAQTKLLLEALPEHPSLVKPNRVELGNAFGVTEPSDNDLVTLGRKLLEQGALSALISAGPEKTLYLKQDIALWYSPPKVQSLNTVGCGDALAGALAVGFHRGSPAGEMVTLALAAASASAETLVPADLDPEEVKRLTFLVSSNVRRVAFP